MSGLRLAASGTPPTPADEGGRVEAPGEISRCRIRPNEVGVVRDIGQDQEPLLLELVPPAVAGRTGELDQPETAGVVAGRLRFGVGSRIGRGSRRRGS